MGKKPKVRAILTESVKERRKLVDALWLSGVVEEFDDPDFGEKKVQVLLESPNLGKGEVALEFDQEDVLAIEPENDEGSARVAIKNGAVYVLHMVAVLRREAPGGMLGEAMVAAPALDLGDWVLSQKSHGHAVAAEALRSIQPASQKSHGHMVSAPGVDLGDWVLSQKSHGHAVAEEALRSIQPASQKSHGHMVAAPEVDLGGWVLSQKSHGHSVDS